MYSVLHTTSFVLGVQVSVSGSKATLSLTTSGPTNCTCMLGDRDPIECESCMYCMYVQTALHGAVLLLSTSTLIESCSLRQYNTQSSSIKNIILTVINYSKSVLLVVALPGIV